MEDAGIRIVPRTEHGELEGFYVKGRRPESVLEWAHTTLAMAHFLINNASGRMSDPIFFGLYDDPLRLFDDALVDIPVVEVGLENIDRVNFGAFALGGALIRSERDMGVGALLFPGAPQIGMGHRASVVHVEADGTVHRMFTDDNANTHIDPDIAVLSSLLLNEY
jgi:hypothetical protein